MRRHWLTAGLCSLILVGMLVGTSLAALNAEQKKELKEITAEIGKISGLISKKKYDDATAAIETAEEHLAEFIKKTALKENDPVLKSPHLQLEKVKNSLAKASGRAAPLFEKNVAPILAAKCTGCHGAEPRGGLSLANFEGLKKGGDNGVLVIPQNPEGSLLLQRLVTPDDSLRMPKGKEPLSEKEIHAIYAWIQEGAKFSGDEQAAMGSLSKSAGKAAAAPKKPVVQLETGTETVHFTKDLMPELVDTCGTCHNDTAKRGGFSVLSFEKLMRGGDSGAVIVGGSLENSRLWRLLNGADDGTPVMPAGQSGITRPWYENMKKWILEGAHYDGTLPDAAKRFPSFDERQVMARNKFTPEQWLELRKKTSEEDWKKVNAKTEPVRLETPDLLLYGDVSEDRLKQIEKWADEHLASLKQSFKIKDEPLWKGKLAVFVFRDRISYEEFNISVQRREMTPKEVIGHSRISADRTEAHVALQDVGDVTETSPGTQVNVIDQLTGAFLRRDGGNLPDWLTRGTGLALAHHKVPGNLYIDGLPRMASAALQKSKLDDPEKLFSDGVLDPQDVGCVGFTLVEFLLKRGNMQQFGQLVQKLQSGVKPEVAIKDVYQTDAKAIALNYAASLPAGGGAKKGKK